MANIIIKSNAAPSRRSHITDFEQKNEIPFVHVDVKQIHIDGGNAALDGQPIDQCPMAAHENGRVRVVGTESWKLGWMLARTQQLLDNTRMGKIME